MSRKIRMCPRCSYTTDYHTNMKKHINRKKMCKPLLKDIIPKDFEESILNGTYEEISKRELIKENKILKETINNLKSTSISNTTINNNDNSTNNTINLNIVLPHSGTNHDFLTDADFMNCINRMIMSVPNLIKRIHFNPEHPENHNICITNSQNKKVMTYDGEKWVMKKQDETIDQLISDHEYMLEEWLDEGEKKFPKAMDKFNKYIKLKGENGVEDTIKDEIKLLLYNNRNVVKTK
jgi:hypothetical protein